MAVSSSSASSKKKSIDNKKKKAEIDPAFIWEGTDKRGNKTKGEMLGKNPIHVKSELKKQGITSARVKKKPKPLFQGGKKAISPMDIAIFTRQLATMMKAGVPLVQSFGIVADGLENPSMRELVLHIKSEVEGGSNLTSALRQHPKHFDDLFCSLVDSGEQSGALETMLDRVAIYKEKSEALKSKIKKAVKYPIAVIIVAFIVTTILLLKVVPTFKELFEGFGAKLPAFTLFVMGLSEWMQKYWWILIGGIAASIYGFKEAIRRFPIFAHYIDKLTLKLPVFGNIVFQATIARYARTLATTFAAGVPLVDALTAVAGATGNSVYRNAVEKIREDVSSGTQLQFCMKSSGLFPAMAVQMVAIGEESGSLDAMLDKVALFYESEVDNSVDGLTSLMEPIIMSVLGVIIGGLIIAMYLPIFQLGSVV